MAVYDSAKTRHAAAMINRLAACMDTEVKPGIRRAAEKQEAISGRTAQAIERELAQLMRKANRLEDKLEMLGKRLNGYADLLEQVDEQLAEEM